METQQKVLHSSEVPGTSYQPTCFVLLGWRAESGEGVQEIGTAHVWRSEDLMKGLVLFF